MIVNGAAEATVSVGLIWALFTNDNHNFSAISDIFSENYILSFLSREMAEPLYLQGATGSRGDLGGQ